MDETDSGRWIHAIGKHLRAYSADAALAALYAIRESARSGELLLRLRGQNYVGERQLSALAFDSSIASQELPTVLQRLDLTGLVSSDRTSDGVLVGLEERILTERDVFRGISQIFEMLNPSNVERALIPLLDLLSRLPLLEAEVIDRVCRYGFDESTVRSALEIQVAFGLLNRQRVGDYGAELYFNEYLWGERVDRLGEILLQLPTQEKEWLIALVEEVRSDQGKPLDQLTAAPVHLVNMAAKIGIIDTTTIITTSRDEKVFTFSPHFYGYRPGEIVRVLDFADQVKLFVASIAYGTYHSPGSRLHSPEAFVTRLLATGEAGEATAILRDYPLLEKQGIVVVEERSPGRGTFVLKKQDIVEQALEVIRNGSLTGGGREGYGVDRLVTQRAFRSPEENRLRPRLAAKRGETLKFDEQLLAATRDVIQKGDWL